MESGGLRRFVFKTLADKAIGFCEEFSIEAMSE